MNELTPQGRRDIEQTEMTDYEFQQRVKRTLEAISAGHNAKTVIRDLYNAQYVRVEEGELSEAEFNKKFEDAVMDTFMAEYRSTPKVFQRQIEPQIESMKASARAVIKDIIQEKKLGGPGRREGLPSRQRMIESKVQQKKKLLYEGKKAKGFTTLSW